jgi:hypothetical protein
VNSIYRELAIDLLTEKIIKTLMPPSYKMLLWGATCGNTIFDFAAERKRHKRSHKYLLHMQKQQVEK